EQHGRIKHGIDPGNPFDRVITDGADRERSEDDGGGYGGASRQTQKESSPRNERLGPGFEHPGILTSAPRRQRGLPGGNLLGCKALVRRLSSRIGRKLVREKES